MLPAHAQRRDPLHAVDLGTVDVACNAAGGLTDGTSVSSRDLSGEFRVSDKPIAALTPEIERRAERIGRSQPTGVVICFEGHCYEIVVIGWWPRRKQPVCMRTTKASEPLCGLDRRAVSALQKRATDGVEIRVKATQAIATSTGELRGGPMVGAGDAANGAEANGGR